MTSPRLATWLEQTWLDCYLDRQLTQEENAWFETYALDKPDLLAAIGVDSTLRDTVAAYQALDPELLASKSKEYSAVVHGGGNAAVAHAMGRKHRSAQISESWHRHFTAIALACAIGGLAIGASSIWLFARQDRLEVIDSPTRIVFGKLRDGPMTARIEHPDSKSPYGLVEVALPPGATGVTLDLGSGEVSSLSPTADGSVSFLLRQELIDRMASATIHYTWHNQRVTVPLTFPKNSKLPNMGGQNINGLASD